MAAAKKQTGPKIYEVPTMEREKFTMVIIGETPLYMHRMSAKARMTLAFGGRPKSAAERKTEIKHNPFTEFMASMDIDRKFHDESAVSFPAMALKSAMAEVTSYVPGMYATDVQRLVYVPTSRIPVFGMPLLKTDIVRSADRMKTPDVRTRAYFPEWATLLTVEHAVPFLPQGSVVQLMTNAGFAIGIGDYRQGKGRGNYGTFRVEVATDVEDAMERIHPRLRDKAAQIDHIENPRAADDDAQEIMDAYVAEFNRRK